MFDRDRANKVSRVYSGNRWPAADARAIGSLATTLLGTLEGLPQDVHDVTLAVIEQLRKEKRELSEERKKLEEERLRIAVAARQADAAGSPLLVTDAMAGEIAGEPLPRRPLLETADIVLLYLAEKAPSHFAGIEYHPSHDHTLLGFATEREDSDLAERERAPFRTVAEQAGYEAVRGPHRPLEPCHARGSVVRADDE